MGELKLWELSNPSDPYTFYAPDMEVAALICLYQGGQVGAQLITAESTDAVHTPFFMLGGAEEWFQANYNRSPQESFAARQKECGEAMCSMVVGSPKARQEYESKVASFSKDETDRCEMFKAGWHDSHRTGMNDFGEYYRSHGEAILKKLGKEG